MDREEEPEGLPLVQRMVTIAAAAFHLGQELGGSETPEKLEAVLGRLREIAAGEVTEIGNHIPSIRNAFPSVNPEAGNQAVRVERETAALVLLGFGEAIRRIDEEDTE